MRHPSSHAPDGAQRTARAGLRAGLIVLACVASLQACAAGGTDPEGLTIPTDTFVTTYVELREATLDLAPERVDSARAAILAEHGLTQQDLLAFADVHGRDVTFMKGVWDEVEKRLDAMRSDSLSVH